MNMEIETKCEEVFGLICSALVAEAERTRGYPSASPMRRLAGLRGLPCRSESHLTYAMARDLHNSGYRLFVDEPYAITHGKGKVRRFDLRIALDAPEDPVFTRFLTLEIKRYLLLDSAFRGMLADVQKITSVLSDEYRGLNLPIGFLLVGFAHEPRDEWVARRLSIFAERANLTHWLHFQRDIEVGSVGQPMRMCLLDLWCFTKDTEW